MRIFLVTLVLVGALVGLTALPLIPDLTVMRQALIVSTGLVTLSLIVANGKRRWSALPDLRLRVALWSVLSAALCVFAVLACLAFSPIGGLQIVCDVRAVRVAEVPTGYPDLDPGRTTWRFTRGCIPDGNERWFQQSRFLILLGPVVPDRG